MRALLIALAFASSAHATETGCDPKGVFEYAFARATHAFCQSDAGATYILSSLLKGIAEGRARFHGGSVALADPSAFTAIALGGYRLDAGMVHRRDGLKYISVHFTGPDPVVKFYEVTYQVDESVIGEAAPKN